jgi:hypothetical protein
MEVMVTPLFEKLIPMCFLYLGASYALNKPKTNHQVYGLVIHQLKHISQRIVLVI